MDRKQQEAVQRATGHTSEVAKAIPEIQELQKFLETTEDVAKVPQQSVKDLEQRIKLLNNRLGQAERAMKHVSDDHADVKAANATIATQQAALAAALETITQFTTKQNAVRDPSKYPNLKADMATLQTLTKAYAPFNFLEQPQRVADTAGRWAEDIKTAQAMFQIYRPLAEQGTFEGKDFLAHYTNFANGVKAFHKQVQEFGEAAPKAAEQSLAKALSMAEKAAANKTPAFFDGGVKQELDNARKHVEVYQILADEKNPLAGELKAKLAEHEKKIGVLKESLKEQILAETPTPADTYSKADKKQLREMVWADWKKRFPNEQVLAVRFFQNEWKRNTGWAWNAGDKSWNLFDYSEVFCRVIVRKDERLATLYYCSLRKDHTSGDATKVTAHRNDLFVVQDMLLANCSKDLAAVE
jgi:hypothetical protein